MRSRRLYSGLLNSFMAALILQVLALVTGAVGSRSRVTDNVGGTWPGVHTRPTECSPPSHTVDG